MIEAAINSLQEPASGELSLRGLSQSLGVSSAAAYRHFPDKSALMDVVAAEGFRMLRDALGKVQPRSAEGMLEMYRRFCREHPGLVAWMFRPRRGALPGPLADAAHECLAEFVALAETAGVRDPERAIRRGVALWSAIHGMAMLEGAEVLQPLERWLLPTALELVGEGS